jgi:hypothetical protein
VPGGFLTLKIKDFGLYASGKRSNALLFSCTTVLCAAQSPLRGKIPCRVRPIAPVEGFALAKLRYNRH